jgi:7-keto-8-aminopelargonate synthetase-like enzyme
MKLSRRAAFASVALATTALTGCAALSSLTGSLTGDKTLVDNIVNSFGLVLGYITSFASPSVSGTATTIFSNLQSFNTSFQALTSLPSGFSLLAVETDINTIVNIAEALPIMPPSIKAILIAVQIILPIAEAGINALLPAAPVVTAPTKAGTRLRIPAGAIYANGKRALVTDPATITACKSVLANAAALYKSQLNAPKNLYY